ncbi:MAG TPA: TPM domain-containing protein [Bacteroidales bacterium]|nr:TPM domain-containing protein [Bacteroidales bacterium]
MPGARNFFTPDQKKAIVDAIKAAELNTSGEIRIHLEETCKGDVLDRAAYLFETLGMSKTEARNGVLIYMAVKDRKFAIIGDSGINAVVEEHYWEDVKHMMAEYFKRGEYLAGLVKAIERTGNKLKKYFPFKADDVNELSDEISFN